MCGICGHTGPKSTILPSMLKYIRRRGPDSEGKFSKNNIHLAATRLSIRDIKNGNQPFIHNDIKFVTIFNGEIYNYEFLKKKIEEKGYLIKTSCDTELIAPGYKFYGEKFFSLIEGMFAFAICDLSKNKLIISRDRYGTKPLYYSIIDNELYFSSSAKSIYNLSFFKKKINIESLQSVLNKRYVEEAKHIFCDIDQLIPGGILEFKDQKLFKKSFLKDINYSQQNFNQNHFIELTENFFDKNIENFKLSDVPIGIMLSSGMDSNLINQKLGRSINDIFTLDFGNTSYNESSSINSSNIYQNQKLNICKFDTDAFNNIYDETIEAFDNPILDSVIFPTNFLMREVAKKVKVVFSGEGADEIFGGYYHFSLLRYVELLKKFSMNSLTGRIISVLPNNFVNLFFQYQGRLGQEGKKRLETVLKSNFKTNNDFNDLISVFSNNDLKKLFKPQFQKNLINDKKKFSKKDIILENFNKWLPNYTLYKTDQLSMHNSLEVRVPYMNNDFYSLFTQLVNFKNSYFYNNKKILVKYLKKNSKIKINKKIALQNYLDDKNKNLFLKMISEKIKKESIIFNFIEYKRFEIIKEKYQLKPELILEKQLSSLLILNSWLEKNE